VTRQWVRETICNRLKTRRTVLTLKVWESVKLVSLPVCAKNPAPLDPSSPIRLRKQPTKGEFGSFPHQSVSSGHSLYHTSARGTRSTPNLSVLLALLLVCVPSQISLPLVGNAPPTSRPGPQTLGVRVPLRPAPQSSLSPLDRPCTANRVPPPVGNAPPAAKLGPPTLGVRVPSCTSPETFSSRLCTCRHGTAQSLVSCARASPDTRRTEPWLGSTCLRLLCLLLGPPPALGGVVLLGLSGGVRPLGRHPAFLSLVLLVPRALLPSQRGSARDLGLGLLRLAPPPPAGLPESVLVSASRRSAARKNLWAERRGPATSCPPGRRPPQEGGRACSLAPLLPRSLVLTSHRVRPLGRHPPRVASTGRRPRAAEGRLLRQRWWGPPRGRPRSGSTLG